MEYIEIIQRLFYSRPIDGFKTCNNFKKSIFVKQIKDVTKIHIECVNNPMETIRRGWSSSLPVFVVSH